MKHLRIIHSLIFFSAIFFVPLQAQQEELEPVKQSDDDAYKNYGYKASIAYYGNKEVINAEEMAKLANAYRLNRDTENSEFWFGHIVEKTTDPQNVFYYAQALQSNGRFEMAKTYYLKYDEMIGSKFGSDDRGELLAEAIDQMNESRLTEVQLKNESLVNSSHNFNPVYFNQGIIFASSQVRKNDKKGKENSLALFYAERNASDVLENVDEFSSGDLPAKYYENPFCISKNGEGIFFTGNDDIKGNRKNSSDVYFVNKEDGSWDTPVALPFNTKEYNEVHPALSPDGTKLYFASDREGGFGGMDLYVSKLENGVWSKPKNLGDKINTAGNEVNPFVHDDGTMYFASNGWDGLGGLDIFSITPLLEDGYWTKVNNLGAPFNSKKDDFGFVMNMLKTEGYLTSTRKDRSLKDDIYRFLMPVDAPTKVKICAYEKETNARLGDVEFEVIEKLKDQSTASLVNVMDMMSTGSTNLGNAYIAEFKKKGYDVSERDVVKIFNTDTTGEIETYLKENRDYLIIATKDGFIVGAHTFEGAKLKGKTSYEFCVPLYKLK